MAAQRTRRGTAGAEAAQTRWELWFAAREASPIRRLTKSGKPPRLPPRLPPNVNERRNMVWRVERGLIAYWRGLAYSLAGEQRIPRLDRIRVSAVVHRRNLGVADEDGDQSRLKPLVDGLRDAGVIEDDSRGHVVWGAVTEERAGEVGPGILLIVESLEV